MINDKDVQKAVDYLQETDVPHAHARAEFSALQELRKTVLAFCWPDTGNQGDKDAKARTHTDYIRHIEKIKQAEIDFHVLHNKRKRAELTVELYRTECANTRKGNI